LERQPGPGAEGYDGLEDEVDNHWGMLFKAAILSTLLSIGAEAGTSGDEDKLMSAGSATRSDHRRDQLANLVQIHRFVRCQCE
jgi:type IV secretory pathway VirB10-like protein